MIITKTTTKRCLLRFGMHSTFRRLPPSTRNSAHLLSSLQQLYPYKGCVDRRVHSKSQQTTLGCSLCDYHRLPSPFIVLAVAEAAPLSLLSTICSYSSNDFGEADDCVILCVDIGLIF